MRAALLALTLLALAALLWWRPWQAPESAIPMQGRDAIPDSVTTPKSRGATPMKPAATPAVVNTVSASGVPIRITRLPRTDAPQPPLGPAYERLRAGAETAPPAQQYHLGQLLYRCREAAPDAAALARQIDQLYQTRRSNGWEVEDPAQEERALRQTYADCTGVPPAARQEYRDWMRRAADGGSMEAQLNLMFHLPQAEYCQFIENCTPQQAQMMETLRDEARAQIARALEGGSVEALRTVGGWALNEEMGTPDPVEAYAHFSAYDQVQQASGRERELLPMLQGLKARLRPVDLGRAEARARELLANPRCCVLTR